MLKPLILSFLLILSTTASGLDTRKGGQVNQVANKSDLVKKAVNSITKKHKGQVLSAKPVDSAQGLRIKVKLLSDDGIIRILFVNPE